MRKIDWIVGSVALCLGLVIGIIGYAVATTPATGNSLLTKIGVGNEAQTAITTIPENSTDPIVVNPNQDLEGNPLAPAEESLAGEGEIDSTVDDNANNSDQSDSSIDKVLSQKITNDYKQNIGYFFGAWQATDMVKFRNQLAKAYVGELYEKHARKAEGFITQGIGLEVSDIFFDEIKVESATANAATLEATYRYVAQDYNLGEQITEGEATEHLVHVRVNLILSGGHWMISGETPL